MSAVLLNGDLLRWITLGIGAITTLSLDKIEDRALIKTWAAKTQAILDRGPDATPTAEEWADVDAFADLEHAKVQAST